MYEYCVLTSEIVQVAKLKQGNFIPLITCTLDFFFLGKSWHIIKKLKLLIFFLIYLILKQRTQKLLFTQVMIC